MIVDIYATTNGMQQAIVSYRYVPGKGIYVIRGSNHPLHKQIERSGIEARGKHYTLYDGRYFMKALPYAFFGSYMYAKTRRER